MERSGLMMSASPVTLIVLFAGTLTACLNIGGPSAQPTLVGIIVDESAAQPVEVTGGIEFIRWDASIQTDNECQKIIPVLDRFSEGNGIVDLAVVATTIAGCPNNNETTWNYTGRLLDIRAGTYEVTIEHRFEDSSRPTEVIFDGQVTVRAP